MHNHKGRHTDKSHFVHLLMRASGGAAAPAASAPSRGNMPDNINPYRKGGSSHRKRKHRDDGGLTGVSPITGTKSPDILPKKKGGRACHAEGDTVATPQKRGGSSHKRKRHAFGDRIRGLLGGDGGGPLIKRPAMLGLAMAARRRLGNAAPDATPAAPTMRRGGSSRRRHADGDEVETMRRGGRKKKVR